MKFCYDTILYLGSAIDGTAVNFKIDELGTQFCCDDMKHAFKSKRFYCRMYDFYNTIKEQRVELKLIKHDLSIIEVCPFCGEQLNFQEIGKVFYRKNCKCSTEKIKVKS